METKKADNAPVSAWPDRTGRLLNGTIQTFNLDEIVDWLQKEATYHHKGHNALTLVKDYPEHDPSWAQNTVEAFAKPKPNGLRTVVVCIKKGHNLAEHNTPGRFTLTMLRGRIRFMLEPQGANVSTELGQGELLVLEEPRRHEIHALEDSAFLLTLTFAK